MILHSTEHELKIKDVELWAVKHILEGDYSLVPQNIKDTIQAGINEIKQSYNTPEYCEIATKYLIKFYTLTKYQFIYFIRECVVQKHMFRSKEVPFFSIIVDNYSSIVCAARRLK